MNAYRIRVRLIADSVVHDAVVRDVSHEMAREQMERQKSVLWWQFVDTPTKEEAK
jgi:hypothetical protein